MKEIEINTRKHTEFVDITASVQAALPALNLREGTVTIFVPHTTAGITINENADPDVIADIELLLEKIAPWKGNYRHGEGNAAAHVKASLVGSSVRVPVENSRLKLGTWQGIFFCEFDGPRQRKVWVSP
jgi:secondary thiamine-phosphate synthase enzyme